MARKQIRKVFCGFACVLLCSGLWAGAFAANFPKPAGYVSDYAGIVPQPERQAIELLATEVESKTSAEIAVVTIPNLPEDYGSIKQYAVDLFADWGIGKKGKDNGLLFLVSFAERKIRIEVGYGLEGIIPDGLTGRIIRNEITPRFKNGRYGEGLLAGASAAAGIIAKDAEVELTGENARLVSQYATSARRGFPFGNLLFLIILFALLGPRLFFPLMLGTMLGGFWGGGRGGFGGGMGGGFGGFGGGMSGGGGASGGW